MSSGYGGGYGGGYGQNFGGYQSFGGNDAFNNAFTRPVMGGEQSFSPRPMSTNYGPSDDLSPPELPPRTTPGAPPPELPPRVTPGVPTQFQRGPGVMGGNLGLPEYMQPQGQFPPQSQNGPFDMGYNPGDFGYRGPGMQPGMPVTGGGDPFVGTKPFGGFTNYGR